MCRTEPELINALTYENVGDFSLSFAFNLADLNSSPTGYESTNCFYQSLPSPSRKVSVLSPFLLITQSVTNRHWSFSTSRLGLNRSAESF